LASSSARAIAAVGGGDAGGGVSVGISGVLRRRSGSLGMALPVLLTLSPLLEPSPIVTACMKLAARSALDGAPRDGADADADSLLVTVGTIVARAGDAASIRARISGGSAVAKVIAGASTGPGAGAGCASVPRSTDVGSLATVGAIVSSATSPLSFIR
jgi:hypothetical protein